MPLSCSEHFKTNALSKSGNYPVSKITVFDCSGTTGRGKGLSREIIDGSPLGTKIWPAIGIKDYSQQMAFNFGESPPLGIVPNMLTDQRTYSIIWNGYFLCGRPIGHVGTVSYSFAYINTGFSFLTLDGSLVLSGSSANQLKTYSSISLSYEKWIRMQVIFSRMGASNRRIQKDRFTLFWKDSIDNQWRVVGSDVTSPALMSHKNVINTPISLIEATSTYALNKTYLLTIHKVEGVYHFHAGESPTEYAVTPGAKQSYNINSDLVDITWSSSIYAGDQAYIYTSGFSYGWDLPLVNDINIESTVEAASTLTFSVPVTTAIFNEDNVTRNNAYTYVAESGNFGILKKNRLIEAKLGYMVNGSEELVTKFTGFLTDIKPSHKPSGDGGSVMTLDVTCMDARIAMVGTPITKISNVPMGPLPDTLCYDLIQRFATTEHDAGPNGTIRPPAFDSWKITDIVRAVCYQNNITSSQLWAKDANGDYLIDDRNVYLERSPAYPYAFTTQFATRTGTHEYNALKTHAGGISNGGIVADVLSTSGLTGWVKDLFNGPNVDYTMKKKISDYYGSVLEEAYLYPFPFDGDPYEMLQSICGDFGLKFGVNTDGNVYLKYPNNPKIYNTHTGDTDTDYIEYTAAWDKVPETYLTSVGAEEQQPIRCFMHTLTEAGTATVHFEGVGLRVIFALPKTTSTATVDIDSVRVDGANILDATTGDIGHREWIDKVDGIGAVDLSSDTFYIGEEDYWYYYMGNNPLLGYNPSIFTICNNLTYGSHTAEIKWNTGTVAIEGFAVITQAVDVPVYIFDDTVDITDTDYDDSLDSMTNDVTIIGNMTGAENDYIQARATDLASIVDPSSPNYIGVRKPWTIITPKVNQQMAEFLAQYLLMTYRRGKRFPNINTTGLTWLIPDDCIAIKDNKLGMYDELAAIDWRWALYFTRYWITATKESFSKSSDGAVQYTMSLNMTNFQPLPAYETLPEPTKADYKYALANVDITIDDDAATYNPYLEDYAGKYVNIEYALLWNARRLAVRVMTAQSLQISGEYKKPTTPVNILTAKTGFIPCGRYINRWDGWVVNTDGTGRYAPNGHYSIEFEVEKYDTGEVFYYRTDAGLTQVLKSGVSNSIHVVQDATIYGTPRFVVTNNPQGLISNPAVVYNDTNSGHGIYYSVTLACPAKVHLIARIRHLFSFAEPVDLEGDAIMRPMEMWECNIPGEAEAPLLDAGSYTFNFNPVFALTKDGAIVPFNGMLNYEYSDYWDHDWWVCWHIEYAARCTDKGVNYKVGANFLDFGQNWACWGGDSATSYDPVYDIKEVHDSIYTYRFYRIYTAP